MRTTAALLALILLATCASAEEPAPQPRLYVVSTAHLDTQWRWTVQDTILDFLPATLRDNFALFERYPDYTFSFEGAFRYALAREYYPAEYERLKQYVADGRWKVAGSWVDAVDPNIPSPESLIRHALYGNGFFRRELGVTSRDVFLPDCFGFGFALPSIAAHSGLIAFSTQKLTWGSSIKIPFDIGLWEGVDGSTLVASVNPGDYASEIKGNLTLDPNVFATIERQNATSGLPVAMRYFGTGDVGIAPMESSVAQLEASIAGPGPLKVESVAPDQLARDLVAGDRAALERLPRYRGEFLLTSHGAGCYTSQAAMKSYNRTNQRLADAAERAAVVADWLGGATYPRERLRDAWTRFLWHQFHDDLTGTSIPEAYVFSWNDEALAAGAFTDVLSDSVGAVTRALDTSSHGVPLVVYNPVAAVREDVVEATLRFKGGAPAAVRVTGPDGLEVPAQVVDRDGETAMVVFVAPVAPVSFSVFEVEPTTHAAPSRLQVATDRLENERYLVRLDASGDVASVYDKALGRELLSGPLRLQLIDDEPRKWAAWEVEYSALMAPPREVVGGAPTVRVVERGPARVALEVVRTAAGSTFTQRYSLATGGAGDRLEIVTEVDWRSPGTLLKAAFPLAAAHRTATYDLGLGVAERPTNRPNLYEVPAQQWADITDDSGAFGVAVVNDSRHGWDKPDGRTLRLSLVHTPRVVPSWSWLNDQASNDLGHHRVVTALVGHAGDWRSGRVSEVAERVNQPLLAWQAPSHTGELGRSFSLLRVDTGSGTPAVAVRAVKLAEESGEVVVRLQELTGSAQREVRLALARPVLAVRELNGAEETLDGYGTGGALPPATRPPLALADGAVLLGLEPFRPRTLALTLGEPPVRLQPPTGILVELPFDVDGISRDDARSDGNLDGEGATIAGELLPATVLSAGIPFRTGPQTAGQPNLLACRGQHLTLPDGDFNRVYLLAAAVGGDRSVRFGVGDATVERLVPDWAEPVGQWDSRLVAGELVTEAARIAPGYVKDVPLGFVGTHRHGARGENQPYVFSYLFRVALDLPAGARTVTLPDDPRVLIAAVTAARNANDDVAPARPLLGQPLESVVRVNAPHRIFTDRTTVTLTSPNPGAAIRYTLDGSPPGPTSAVYSAPLVLDRTTTLSARAFAPGLDDRFVATATYTKTAPHPAVDVPATELAPGLACDLYEGDFRDLPDFAALTPARSLVLPTVELPADRPGGSFALRCQGFLSIPADGVQTLALRAEDGAELWVDGERALTEDWIDYTRRPTVLPIAAGLHSVEVRYFQHDFVAGLQLLADAPDRPLESVPPERLFHRVQQRQ